MASPRPRLLFLPTHFHTGMRNWTKPRAWCWQLIGINGRIILRYEGFATKAAAKCNATATMRNMRAANLWVQP